MAGESLFKCVILISGTNKPEIHQLRSFRQIIVCYCTDFDRPVTCGQQAPPERVSPKVGSEMKTGSFSVGHPLENGSFSVGQVL